MKHTFYDYAVGIWRQHQGQSQPTRVAHPALPRPVGGINRHEPTSEEQIPTEVR